MREIIFDNKWIGDGDVMDLHEIMIRRCIIWQLIILKPRLFGDRAWVLAIEWYIVPDWLVFLEPNLNNAVWFNSSRYVQIR